MPEPVLVDRLDLRPVVVRIGNSPDVSFSVDHGVDELGGDQLGATQLLAVERMIKRSGEGMTGPRLYVRSAWKPCVNTH